MAGIGMPSVRPTFPAMTDHPPTAVPFNASCPVCGFEIGHCARYCRDAGLPIRFDDLNTDARAAWGIDADRAARRLYVVDKGQLTSGIPAFRVLWARMPRDRWLARVVGLPGVRQIAAVACDVVLAPAICRSHRRRLRCRSAAVAG
jgi:predicted DCC family thiol-disulfide oxidoreductase YuxK